MNIPGVPFFLEFYAHAWSAWVVLNNWLYEMGPNALLFHLTVSGLTTIVDDAARPVRYAEAVDHTLKMASLIIAVA